MINYEYKIQKRTLVDPPEVHDDHIIFHREVNLDTPWQDLDGVVYNSLSEAEDRLDELKNWKITIEQKDFWGAKHRKMVQATILALSEQLYTRYQIARRPIDTDWEPC